MFVTWSLQNSSGPTVNLEAKRSQNGTNMRGSSVSLANMEICKKIHRKSKCVSSRGEDTEVTVQLLKKMNCFQCLWNRTSSNGLK